MLPKLFVERMKKMLGDGAESLISELESGDNVKAMRVNTLKISVEDFQKVNCLDVEKIPFIADGYYTNEEKPGNTAQHHSGMIYMQDPGAMSTVCAMNISPGMRVLDTCASPGGKSSQLASLVGEDGLVVSNEYVPKRATVLQGNLERMGCRSSVVLNLDARELCNTYYEYFDAVVCDAPCSGEGMFRKNPVAISEWSIENVLLCAERQTDILNSVEKCVAVGGLLLYSTCTFSLEENEMVIDKFLCSHENYKLIDVRDEIKFITADGINFDGAVHDLTAARRFYPDKSRGEGQFMALMKKIDSSNAEFVGKAKIKNVEKRNGGQERRRDESVEALKIAKDFICENLVNIPNKKLEYKNGIVRLCPECPLPEYGVIGCGVCVGEIVKGRLVPHHQFFSAYGNDFKNKIILHGDDPRVAQYIRGLEIEANGTFDGYAVVICDGCALGGVKVSGGRAKNHYPKGLRNPNF